jgi:hypothetical protein
VFEPESPDAPSEWVINDEEEADMTALMSRLCKYLYSLPSADRFRLRAMLCHIYHHAIFDRWTTARDLMLMGHIQENITHADIDTQILYNRTMVQLGLCAFRAGQIYEAQQALHDIWSLGKVKELLAQGVHFRRDDKTKEELSLETRRQTPFHLHINIELIESVYYTASMLLEVPYMALQQLDPSRFRNPIRPYRRQLDIYCKQAFNAPPENTREHIMAGSLALLKGDWATCADHILNLKAWARLQNAATMKDILLQRIKQEGLRAFLFTVSGHYDSISLAALAGKFELDLARVHGVVSKMIFTRELRASHDQPTKAIIFHKASPSVLQRLALNFAEKVGQFVENNERLVDMRQGGYGYKDRQNQGHQRSRQRFGNYRKFRPYHERGGDNRRNDAKGGAFSWKK